MATSPDPAQWFVDDWATPAGGDAVVLAHTLSGREAQVRLTPVGKWEIYAQKGPEIMKEDHPVLIGLAVKFFTDIMRGE
jgi:hypothetical protein